MNYPLQGLGGTGQIANLAIGIGFPPETYLPMLRPLMMDYRFVSLLPRALWGDEPVPKELRTWETDLTEDMIEGMRFHRLTGIIGIGHSFGANATITAALQDPTLFRALVLLDPPILAPNVVDWIRAMQIEGSIGKGFFPAARAINRMRHFSSRDEAYAHFRTRGIFREWDDAAVREYVAHGLSKSVDGFTLTWTPEWEAHYFKTYFTGIWEVLPKLDGLLPTLIVRGSRSDSYPAGQAAEVQELLPNVTHLQVFGHGHNFPHSAPYETARIIRTWLRESIGSRVEA